MPGRLEEVGRRAGRLILYTSNPENGDFPEGKPAAPPKPGPHFTRDRNRSDVADSPALEESLKQDVRESVELLHGPGEVEYDRDELVVLCQTRNSRHYIKSFVEHYFSLGAKHIVFLDNSSSDGTVEALKKYDNVTVLRTELPYKTYNVAMKQYLIERFGKDRWSLLVDIDELFDYPYSEVVSLKALLGYLDEQRYTAVVANMLDMFPENPISRDASLPDDEPLKELYRFYDLSNVNLHDYSLVGDAGNVLANEEVGIFRGGIRKTLFGNDATLIKHPLIFLNDKIKPMDLSDHWVGNARIADFTGVLLHYKLSNRLYRDVTRSVEERNRSEHGTRRYAKYLRVLEENPVLRIRQDTARELGSVKDLVDNGFMVVSRAYMEFVASEGRKSGGEDFLERHSEDLLAAFLQARSEANEQRRKAAPGAAAADQLREDTSRNPIQRGRNRSRPDAPDSPYLEKVQQWLLRHGTELLHGPGEVEYERDELVVLCLLRDGRHYLKSFVEHYFSLGAKHIVFLDNGSTDGTVEALKKYDSVTVLRTGLPFKKYQLSMRRYLIERFGKERWSLLVDIDELFDYPYSEVVSLKALLGYLDENRYTAVVANMLDMFPENPISENSWDGDELLKETHRFYDLSNVNTYGYQVGEGDGNLVSNEEIGILQGGIQRTLFDLRPPLTKHPLVFLDDEIKPVDLSEHWASNARIADFTGMLLHYKLFGNLYGLVRREINEGRYVNRYGKYEKYHEVLERSPELEIKRGTSRELESTNDLVGTPFTVVSEEYMKLVEGEARTNQDSTASAGLGMMAGPFFRAQAEASAQRRRAEQLELTTREGPGEAYGDTEESNRSLREQSDARAAKIRELNQRIRVLAPQARESVGLRNRKRELEGRIGAIQSSRVWRLLTALRRLRAKMRGRKGA